MKPWGWHLALDCMSGDERVKDKQNIEQFSKILVERIDMIAYGEPQVVHFADHAEDKAGWTLVQLIETSNICCHFLDCNGDFYLDVFSCKEFNVQTVIDTVREFFAPEMVKPHFFTRNARSEDNR